MGSRVHRYLLYASHSPTILYRINIFHSLLKQQWENRASEREKKRKMGSFFQFKPASNRAENRLKSADNFKIGHGLDRKTVSTLKGKNENWKANPGNRTRLQFHRPPASQLADETKNQWTLIHPASYACLYRTYQPWYKLVLNPPTDTPLSSKIHLSLGHQNVARITRTKLSVHFLGICHGWLSRSLLIWGCS